MFFHHDIYCSLIETEKRDYEFGIFSLQELTVSLAEANKTFPKQELLEKISKSNSRLRETVSFDKTRVICRSWIHKVEKNSVIQNGGMHCCECNEYYHYAVPNLSDKRMACWSCRDSYKWKYSELFVG